MSSSGFQTELEKLLTQPLKDMDGCYSSKRVIAFLAFYFMLGVGIANVGWGLQIAPFIYDSMLWIVLGGLGITVAENVADVIKKSPGKTDAE